MPPAAAFCDAPDVKVDLEDAVVRDEVDVEAAEAIKRVKLPDTLLATAATKEVLVMLASANLLEVYSRSTLPDLTWM